MARVVQRLIGVLPAAIRASKALALVTSREERDWVRRAAALDGYGDGDGYGYG